MKSLAQSAVWMAAALLATALVGVTVAEEPADGNLQGSWNDYPAKNFGNSDIPTVTPSNPNGEVVPPTDFIPEQPQPPATMIPPGIPPMDYPPGLIPPRQQQQGKPSGGGIPWGGGKQGGFNWGKAKPPQSQQGAAPGGGQGNPNQAQLLEYIRQLQMQNAQLRALLQRLVEQQEMMNGERSPGMPNAGVPLE